MAPDSSLVGQATAASRREDAAPGHSHWLRATIGSVLCCLPILASAATFVVTNTNSSGPGSLRAAIEAANNTIAEDRIEFNIPGSGPFVIAGILPTVNRPLVIDGYSAAGSVPNSQIGRSNNAQLRIVINIGQGWRVEEDLELAGVAVHAGGGGGLLEIICAPDIGQCGNLVLRGNYFGTDHTGEAVGGPLAVHVGRPTSTRHFDEVLIGGRTAADRNLFVNAHLRWLRKQTGVSHIVNNSFGYRRNGTLATNGCVFERNGISEPIGLVIHEDRLRVGGLLAIERNFIGCGALVDEAPFAFSPANESLQFIGNVFDAINSLGASPAAAIIIKRLPEGSGGIGGLVIGGTASGAGNTIRNYAFDGVMMEGFHNGRARLLSNSIHSIGGLPFDLQGDGVTVNDPNDGDEGPNSLQNMAVPTLALREGDGDLALGLQLNVGPTGENFEFEVHANPVCAASGFGPQTRPQGRLTRTLSANATTSLVLAAGSHDVQPGEYVSVSMTRLSTGETSESSACARVTSGSVGSVSGRVFFDRNGNGQFDPGIINGDVGLSGRVVYIDRNENGQFDGDSEFLGATDARGVYEFLVGPVSEIHNRLLRTTTPEGLTPSASTPNPRQLPALNTIAADFAFTLGDALLADGFE